MFRSHSEAIIAVANCTTLFFLARKILNYIRLQSARVSGKPLENRRGQHVDKRASCIALAVALAQLASSHVAQESSQEQHSQFSISIAPAPSLFSPPPLGQKQQLLVTSCPQFFHIFFWHIFRTYCPHFEWLLSSSASSLRLGLDWSVESTTRATHHILIPDIDSSIIPPVLLLSPYASRQAGQPAGRVCTQWG